MDQHVGPYVDPTHNRYRSLRLWSGWVSSSGSAIWDQGTEKERPRRGTKNKAWLTSSPPPQIDGRKPQQIPFQGGTDMTSSSPCALCSRPCPDSIVDPAFGWLVSWIGKSHEIPHEETMETSGGRPAVRNTGHGHMDRLGGTNVSHRSWAHSSRKFYETGKCGRQGEILNPHPSEI